MGPGEVARDKSKFDPDDLGWFQKVDGIPSNHIQDAILLKALEMLVDNPNSYSLTRWNCFPWTEAHLYIGGISRPKDKPKSKNAS